MLRLDTHWVWDSWIADDGDRYHLFFLKAPRSLGDAGKRHRNATVGHAVSYDLATWELLPDALGPDPDGWDDLAIWTGSVARGDDGVWRMYYTAINTRGHDLKDQKVGVVESDDLVTWRRVTDTPVCVPDPRWYKTLDEDGTASETWRDPLVFKLDDGWHMLVCARGLDAGRNDDGVLAHATSQDMMTWEVGPPVCNTGHGFGQLEVAQVREIDGRHVLVFTCHPQEQTDDRRETWGDHCTWSVPGEPGNGPLGPWDIAKARPFVAEPDLFAAPLVQRRDGSWALVGFRNLEPKGTLSFDILDPVPVHLEDGVLVADEDYEPAPVLEKPLFEDA